MTDPKLYTTKTINVPLNKEKEFDACMEALELMFKKSQDYNTGVEVSEYFPFGLTSYVHMIYTKALRLVSFCRVSRKANFESVEDSLKDLINYAAYTIVYIKKHEKVDESRRES